MEENIVKWEELYLSECTKGKKSESNNILKNKINNTSI